MWWEFEDFNVQVSDTEQKEEMWALGEFLLSLLGEIGCKFSLDCRMKSFAPSVSAVPVCNNSTYEACVASYKNSREKKKDNHEIKIMGLAWNTRSFSEH